MYNESHNKCQHLWLWLLEKKEESITQFPEQARRPGFIAKECIASSDGEAHMVPDYPSPDAKVSSYQ